MMMELTIRPTEEFFMAGEVMVRMWQGTDQNGTEVVAFVSLITFPGQQGEVAAHLVPIPPPTPEAARRWAEEVLARAPP